MSMMMVRKMMCRVACAACGRSRADNREYEENQRMWMVRASEQS